MAYIKYGLDAIDPFDKNGTGLWKIGLEQEQWDELYSGDHAVRISRLKLVKEASIEGGATVVFQDWMRDRQEDGLCYCGTPKSDCHGCDDRGITITLPPPPGMVFCAYVKPSGRLCRWDWEPADRDNPAYPENWNKKRFRRIVWPTIQEI